MNTNDEQHLASRLRSSVDDHPVTVPNLLPAARASRTRRRLGGVAAASVLAIGGVTAVSLAMNNGAVVASPIPASPAPTTPGEEKTKEQISNVMSNEQVAAACQAQLSAYDTSPNYQTDGPVEWTIAHTDQAYTVGDPVLFVDPAGRAPERLCIVPEPGDTTSAIPDPAPTIADPGQLAALCSQLLRVNGKQLDGTPAKRPDFSTPDLRKATMVHGAQADDIVTALLKLGDSYYSCQVSDLAHSDLGHVSEEVKRPASGDEFWGVSATYYLPGGGKSKDPSVKPYLIGSGFAPVKGATSMRIDGRFTVEINDGTYSFVQQTEPKQMGALVVDFLDADGKVLFTSNPQGGKPYLVP